MSQGAAILNYMKSGNTLSPMEALHRFGCMRLAARIKELRRDGHNIVTTKKKVGDKSFAEYRIV